MLKSKQYQKLMEKEKLNQRKNDEKKVNSLMDFFELKKIIYF